VLEILNYVAVLDFSAWILLQLRIYILSTGQAIKSLRDFIQGGGYELSAEGYGPQADG